MKKNLIDLDALIPKRDDIRAVSLGKREFNVSDIPVEVAAVFMRARTDPNYSLSDAMIDGSVAMLNQGLSDGEKIDKAWFLSHVDGATLEPISDVILSPFYERRFQKMLKPKVQEIQEPEPELEPTMTQ